MSNAEKLAKDMKKICIDEWLERDVEEERQ